MKFSVLMSVYAKDVPTQLDEALRSIWDDQTLKPAHLVLVQDGPLPADLSRIVDAWKKRLDDVLTIVPLLENVGLGAALNAGLQHCRHELIARMDADDISLATRFEKQSVFMDECNDIAACSAQLEEWDSSFSKNLDERRLPLDSGSVRVFAKRRCPLSHPLVMFRKSAVEAVGGYPPLRKAQDYALWSLLLVHGYNLANLPDVLLKMRTGEGLFDRRDWKYFKYELQLLNYQRGIGFLSISDFVINSSLKAVLRLSPRWLKILAYRLARYGI